MLMGRSNRFGIGGILAGLWIFLVPAARRLELGLYSIRLSMLTLWKIGAKKGWWIPRRYVFRCCV